MRKKTWPLETLEKHDEKSTGDFSIDFWLGNDEIDPDFLMIFWGFPNFLWTLGVPHFETLRQPLSKERRQSAASSVAWLRKLEPPYWLSSNIFHINHGGDFGGCL